MACRLTKEQIIGVAKLLGAKLRDKYDNPEAPVFNIKDFILEIYNLIEDKEKALVYAEALQSKGYESLVSKEGKCFGCNRSNRPIEFYSHSGYFVFAINFYRTEGKLVAIPECDYSTGSGRIIRHMSDGR